MASDAGGRGPKSTSRWTWTSAFSPENSCQIFASGARTNSTRRQETSASDAEQIRRSGALEERSNDFTSSNTPSLDYSFVWETESGDDPLKIVVPVVFDFYLPAFFSVVNGDVRAHVLLQTILQIFDRSGTRA